MKKLCLFLLMATAVIQSCTTDSYEKGEGEYSQMCADFVELSTNADCEAVAFTTDGGQQWTLSEPTEVSWMNRPDTIYRALLYYNKLDDGRAESVAVGYLPTLQAGHWWELKPRKEDVEMDPLGFESAWVSRGGKYLNVGLLLKSGQVDDADGAHLIGIVQDTITVNPDQTRTAYYRLRHDQNGTPQYYTNRRYVSVLLPASEQLDTVRFTVQTYDGVVLKVLPVKPKE